MVNNNLCFSISNVKCVAISKNETGEKNSDGTNAFWTKVTFSNGLDIHTFTGGQDLYNQVKYLADYDLSVYMRENKLKLASISPHNK